MNYTDQHHLVWNFDRPVTLLGPALPAFDAADDHGGPWFSPTVAEQTAANVITCTYAADLAAFGAWMISNNTQGISPATPVLAGQEGETQ